MSSVLLIVGIVMAAAGVAMLGFGVPTIEFTTGTTLVIAGATIFSGGLVLIGLAAVVTELGRVTEGLKVGRMAAVGRSAPAPAAEPAPLPGPVAMAYPAPSPPPAPPMPRAVAPMAAQAPPPPAPPPAMPRRPDAAVRPSEPYPAGTSGVEVSAAAIERLRSSFPRSERPRADAAAEMDEAPLSPNGTQPRPGAIEAPIPESPATTAEDRVAGGDPSKKSRLDFLFRSKPGRSGPASQPQGENFETAWPDARPPRPPQEAAAPRYEQAEQPAPERRQEPAPDPRGTAILKSGVVDGMAYTLYADGSIEAKLPHGTVRFGSIAELRSHIEHNSGT